MTPGAPLRHPGVRAALTAAALFGAGTPAAKLLLDSTNPWLLAGLLYLGSGIGLALVRSVRRPPRVRLAPADRWPLAGAVLAGGVLGPLLLMVGLTHLPATGASLLLNAEGVATAVLAWTVFGENVDRRVLAGLLAIVAGAVLLTTADGVGGGALWPSMAVLGACLCWGLDNNLTGLVAVHDASWLAMVKGLAAGVVNLTLAFAVGATLPHPVAVGAAMAVGFLAYGVSLVLFIVGLRHVGTARAGAYFSVAPFFGAVLAAALGEPVTWPLVGAGTLMAIGVWLHLREHHGHRHAHTPAAHEHGHTHDDGHHDHDHPTPVPAGTRHQHAHTHAAVVHTHPHYPDSHHRHRH